ncbi:MAG: hypothetical protein JWM97_129 [Phycisphaerales bacterium]|nr:hypothetical protein [Phycisphaerales bacterium]
MIVNLVFATIWCLIALYFAFFEGVGIAFALCYIPALMFLRPVKGYALNGGWPEFGAANATIIALSVGMIFRIGTPLKIRWSLIDTLVVLAPCITITSAINTEVWHTGYNELVKQYCGWVVPYFVARFAFRSEAFREKMLWVIITCLVLLMPMVLIELRLWPHFYVTTLQKLGLSMSTDLRAEQRLGLFRTSVSFTHSIFFGDACVSLGALILVLAATTRVGLKNFWVRVGLACCGFGLFAALSGGPFAGVAIAVLTFCLLRYVRFSRPLLWVGVLAVVAVMFMFTMYLATAPMPPRPRDGSMGDSFWVRRLIVQNCWKQVQDAGLLGHGRIIAFKDIDLDSVDNAYVLFAMCRGWIYAALWIAIPLFVGTRVAKAMGRYTLSQMHIFPLAVGAATILGVSFAFYWVWAGWAGEPYTMLWLILIAFTMTLCDQCLEAADEATLQQRGLAGRPLPALATARPAFARGNGAPYGITPTARTQ